MYYFDAEVYDGLYQMLYETDPDLASDFATFFTQYGDGYSCTNYNGYMNFLTALELEDEVMDLFTAWDPSMMVLSTQGGGVLPKP